MTIIVSITLDELTDASCISAEDVEDEDIVVFTDNYVQIFFNADMDDITAICSNLDDDAHLVLTSTQDVETDHGTVGIYYYTIETGSDTDTGDTYLISYDPEIGTASFQAVIGQ